MEVSGEDEVGLEIQFVPTDDDNAHAQENIPSSKNQEEAVYNVYWGHDGICRRHLIGARNHNACVHFAPDIEPTQLQLFQIFLFRDFIEGVLQHNANERIEGKKVTYGDFIVFIGVWLIVATTQGPLQRDVC